ncbi:type I restriction enzyme specificity HsdS domain protein [Mycoplasma haemofelis Ohio2]|uniref:Type I restriction enzyme specificity HsdS domain protein n=1 Tax=Mycoplasma haemofelis (strain Ohio2) TaxID=859194 RepID=F6FIK1_MYCHI|nr:type I restriction enzyme specificity HsdS domain protein [Mycoplasma haemofelis Ohio2]
MSFKSFLSESKDVKHLKLKDVCKIIAGKRFTPYTSEGMPVLRSGNIIDGYVVDEDFVYCDREKHPRVDTVKYGDILIVRFGSAGVVGMNLINREFFLDANLSKFSPDSKILHKQYLYHFLLSRQEEIKGWARGAVIPAIRKSDLEELMIPVPSLEQQQTIASKLDKLVELKRELILRKEQHSYYRKQIWEACSNGCSK